MTKGVQEQTQQLNGTTVKHENMFTFSIKTKLLCIYILCNNQFPDFDDMPSFFPCEIDDAIQYINLGYEEQAPKIVIL